MSRGECTSFAPTGVAYTRRDRRPRRHHAVRAAHRHQIRPRSRIGRNRAPLPAHDSAGGSVSIGQAFVTAFKLSDAEALTQKAQVALEPPIANPPLGIVAVMTPTPAPNAPDKATGTIAKASYDGKNVLLDIACKAGGATCTGSAEAIARLKVKAAQRKAKHATAKAKPRFTQVTVAKSSFSIPTGQTQTLKLKISKTATGLIAKLGKLPTTITLTLSQPDRSSAEALSHLTLVRHKAKKGKHKH